MVDTCNIQDFSFNLGFNGGDFSILAGSPLGSRGSEINIYGLSGTITREGEKISTSAFGYLTKGIFGTPLLNREFSIITSGNANYFRFLNSALSGDLYTTQIDWQTGLEIKNSRPTVSELAINIARSCGIHLGWYVVDAPYTDPVSQLGQTGLEALGSLASQVGGQLRWYGGNQYVVSYPDHFLGRWDVPTSNVITSEGVEFENILDLGLGLSGTGVTKLVKPNTFGTDTANTPTNEAGGEPPTVIDRVYSSRQPLTDDDPPEFRDLPADTVDIKFQVLLKANTTTTSGTGGTFNSSGTFNASSTITTDENTWQSLGGISITNPFVSFEFGKPILKITKDIFPDVDEVNNGNFVFSVGIERRNLTPDYEKEQDDWLDKQRDLFGRFVSNIRFLRNYEATINCYFFGSIPLPGMWASATVCGPGGSRTVEGIVESVSFNAPGILTIGVAQYLRVNLLDSTLNGYTNPTVPLNRVI